MQVNRTMQLTTHPQPSTFLSSFCLHYPITHWITNLDPPDARLPNLLPIRVVQLLQPELLPNSNSNSKLFFGMRVHPQNNKSGRGINLLMAATQREEEEEEDFLPLQTITLF